MDFFTLIGQPPRFTPYKCCNLVESGFNPLEFNPLELISSVNLIAVYISSLIFCNLLTGLRLWVRLNFEEEVSRPQGAITRGRAAAILQQNGGFEQVKRQSVTITRDETTNRVSYNVTRGALVLGFQLLLLRDPGPQERDIVLSIQDLPLYA
jgi:hypothetical protein